MYRSAGVEFALSVENVELNCNSWNSPFGLKKRSSGVASGRVFFTAPAIRRQKCTSKGIGRQGSISAWG